MLIGAIAGAIAGIVLLIIGISKNNDLIAVAENILNGGSGKPGTVFIVIGIILIVAAAGLCGFYFYKKKKG